MLKLIKAIGFLWFGVRRNKKITIIGFCFGLYRTFVGTWNVGGKSPQEDLNLRDWLKSTAPADIYVLGYALLTLQIRPICLIFLFCIDNWCNFQSNEWFGALLYQFVKHLPFKNWNENDRTHRFLCHSSTIISPPALHLPTICFSSFLPHLHSILLEVSLYIIIL